MTKSKKIRLGLIGLIILGIVIQTGRDFLDVNARGLAGFKKETEWELPVDYNNIFKASVEDISTIKPIDDSYFPISSVKVGTHYAKLFKFESSLALTDIIEIKKEQTSIQNALVYTEEEYDGMSLSYAETTLSKKLQKADITYTGELNNLVLTDEIFLSNGKLKTLGIRFLEETEMNSFFAESFAFRSPEFSLAMIKMNASVYLVFFPSSKISKDEFFRLFNL